MQSIVYYCDKCGKETAPDAELYLDESRASDAAGGMETNQYHADLCPQCLKMLLMQAFKICDVRFPGKVLRTFVEGG